MQFQVDSATGDLVNDTDGNPIPIMEDCVQEIGSSFDIWHNLDNIKVLKSCCIHHQHAENVDCQNLAWSHELLMKNVDSTLQQHTMLACENSPECAFSEAFAFFVIHKANN